MGRRLRSQPRLQELETIYREHHRRVRWVLRGRGVGDDVLDDLVQEVFLALYRRLPERDPSVPMPSWVAGVARNIAFSHRRSSARRIAAVRELPEPAPVVEPDEAIARRRAWVELEAFLDALDPDQREVFVLSELLGMKVPEVAAVVDAPLNTLYSRLRLARRRFNARFGPAANDGLAAAGRAECPSKRQRQHAWVMIAGQASALATPVAAVATGSVAVKWLLAGGLAAGAIGTVAVVADDDAAGSATRQAAVSERPAAAAKQSESPNSGQRSPSSSPAGTAEARPRDPLPPAIDLRAETSDAVASLSATGAKPVPSGRPSTSASSTPASPLGDQDPLGATVVALRSAQQAMQHARAGDALAALDRLSAASVAPTLRREFHSIARDAACRLGKTERAQREHDALVKRGAAVKTAAPCEKKSTTP